MTHGRDRVDGRRALVALLLYVLAVAGVAAFGGPLIYRGIVALGADGATLAEVTFRTLQLGALVGTFWLLRALGGGGPRAWGVPTGPGALSRLGAGLLLGVASLGAVCGLLYVLDVRLVRPEVGLDAGFWLLVVLKSAVAAAVIALLEEFWFRGGLHAVFERLLGGAAAVVVTAVVYAGSHFLDRDTPADAESLGVLSGSRMLAAAFAGLWQVQNLDSFLALVVAGILLGILRLRQGDVAMCLGVHAGWVLAIKVFKKATYIDPKSPLRGVAGRYDDVIGWLAAAVLALVAVGIYWWAGRRQAPRP